MKYELLADFLLFKIYDIETNDEYGFALNKGFYYTKPKLFLNKYAWNNVMKYEMQ